MPRVFDRKVAVSVIAAKHCIDSSIALMMVMMSYQGASIYDVRTEGGGGVSPKEDVVREVA